MRDQHFPRYQQAGYPDPGQTMPPARRPRRRIWPYIAVAALTLALAAGAAGYMLLHKPAGTFDTNGSLLMTNGDDFTWDQTTKACTGSGAYADVANGAAVVVRDAGGKTVATGFLGHGTADNFTPVEAHHVLAGSCEFGVIVLRVPDGSRFYTIQVSGREQVTFPRSQMDFPQLKLG